MQPELSEQDKINILVEAIRKAVKEIEPTMQIKDEKIVGLIILQFPEDHNKDGAIVTTFMGKVCFPHTFEAIEEAFKMTIHERNLLAE